MPSDEAALARLTGDPVTWQVVQADLIRYSAVSRDFNDIHYDDSAAKAAGFPRPIAHGMLTVGLLLTRVADELGVDAVRASETRFRAPAPVCSQLTLSFEAGGTAGALAARVTDEAGQLVLTSQVEAGPPAPASRHVTQPTRPAGELVAERTLVVEQGPATRFADALGAKSPVFHRKDAAEAAGHPSIPVVPTFAFALPGWGFFPELPCNEHAETPDAVRDCQAWAKTDGAIIHASQGFRHTRPMYVGETITARSFVTDRSAKRRGDRVLEFTSVATHFTDVRAAHVLTSAMTLVVTE